MLWILLLVFPKKEASSNNNHNGDDNENVAHYVPALFKRFRHINFLNSYDNPMRLTLSLYAFYRWESGGTKQLTGLSVGSQ